MKVIVPPNPFDQTSPDYQVFLAGSIEMGNAALWQDQVIELLKPYNGTIYNPRRPEWDDSWKQEIENKQFLEQVSWELTAMESSDIILMYLDPATKSPISLLELGLHANDNKLVVYCPKGFWRKGNVDIVCERYNVPQINSFREFLQYVEHDLQYRIEDEEDK
jgi:hypothetical protein